MGSVGIVQLRREVYEKRPTGYPGGFERPRSERFRCVVQMPWLWQKGQCHHRSLGMRAQDSWHEVAAATGC